MTTKKNPQQGQVSNNNKELDCFSVAGQCYNGKDAAQFLGKSPVTISIWKKQGNIVPDHYHGQRGYYSLALLQSFQQPKPDQICPLADDCLNMAQTAQFLGKSLPTIYKWIKENLLIPDHKLGRSFHFTSTKLNSFQYTYKTSLEQPDQLDLTTDLRTDKIIGTPPLLTTPTYETEALMPFKNQSKFIEVLIADANDKPQLLFMFLGMLITILIKLLLYTQ